MLDDWSQRAGAGKHQRNVEQVEDDQSDQESPRPAKDLPASKAEQKLHQKIKQRKSLQVHAQSRPPRDWKQGYVRLMMNDVEHDVRQNAQADRGTYVSAAHRAGHPPRERGEQDSGQNRMRVR